MQVTDATARSLVMDQPTSTVENSSKGGLFHGLRCVFYRYDPLEGTKPNLIPCGATTLLCAAAGAYTGECVAEKITVKTLEQGANLAERAVSKVESVIKEHPLLCGAIVGGTFAITGIQMLGDSLKPIARDAIENVRDGMRHQIHKQCQLISHHQGLIAQHQKRLAQLERFLPAEEAESKQISEKQYAQNLTRYYRQADSKAGELKGFIEEIMLQRQSGFRHAVGVEATHQQRQGPGYEVGRALTDFMHYKDYSYPSQRKLLSALEPVLTEQELNKVKSILSDFPWKPVLWMKQGPIAREFEDIRGKSSSEQRTLGQIELSFRRILDQYPNLKPDKDGLIPDPSAEEFKRYLPD